MGRAILAEALEARRAEDVVEILLSSSNSGEGFSVEGSGSKDGLGRPAPEARALSLRRISGLRLYEPEELVFTAMAGTSLLEIEAALAEKRQRLAFSPPDWGPLFGKPKGGGTLGGAVACDLSGATRLGEGALRDHILGVKAVSGEGVAFQSGGRVVKNVTGYDLGRLLTRSYGTLAIITEATLKAMPKPEAHAALIFEGLGAKDAVRAMRRAVASPLRPASAAWIPETLLSSSDPDDAASQRLFSFPFWKEGGGSVTSLGLEGSAASLKERLEMMALLINAPAPSHEIWGDEARDLWRQIGEVSPFAAKNPETAPALWRILLPPASGAGLAEMAARLGSRRYYLDWGGALGWLEAPASHAGELRREAARLGGEAHLFRAPDEERLKRGVFMPLSDAMMALHARVKDAFDPKRRLNAGRIYEGI